MQARSYQQAAKWPRHRLSVATLAKSVGIPQKTHALGERGYAEVNVLKLRCCGFTPQRGSPKLAQGKRPSGAPPWVENVTGFGALKGRPYVHRMNSAAPSGLGIPDDPPTQGVALGWHNTAPSGLKSQTAQLQNFRFGLVLKLPLNPVLRVFFPVVQLIVNE